MKIPYPAFMSCILLLSAQALAAQVIHIPDANFKHRLVNCNSCATLSNGTLGNVDTNNNGEIEADEAVAVIKLNVNTAQISSLTGIHHFVNLEELRCQANLLTSLDVSGLTSLKLLSCGSNMLTSLNLSGLPALEVFSCAYNFQLTTLHLSGLTALHTLNCHSTQISSLDLSGLPALRYVDCSHSKLTSLTVEGLSSLEELFCSSNRLPILNLTGLTALRDLKCGYNQLTAIDVSGLSSLKILWCGNNLLTTLDVSGLSNLQSLECSNNLLTSIHTSGLVSLWQLVCGSNQLTTLHLESASALTDLRIYNNPLQSLFMKNGSIHDTPNALSGFFGAFPQTLNYICCDEGQIEAIQTAVSGQNCAVNTYCSFTPGGVFYTLQGINRVDWAGGDCAGPTNGPIQNMRFRITGNNTSGTFIANKLGNYSIPLQAGTHLVTPEIEHPEYFFITPPSLTAVFPAPTDTVYQDFCLTAVGTRHDVEVSFAPITPLRPGFEATFRITYRNKGNQLERGTVTFNYNEALLDFESASITPDGWDSGTITWSFTDLPPLHSRYIDVTLRCNSPVDIPPVQGGSVLSFNAAISPDGQEETPDDNSFTSRITAVNAYDPNDKTCLQGSTISPDMAGRYIHFLIRFENTGTYYAENVVVKDVIDTLRFDIRSLQPVETSHNMFVRIRGNVAEFIFQGIQLPYYPSDLRHGFVAFKVKTKPDIALGDMLKNQAEIFFDFNFPIITNETNTIVAQPVRAIDPIESLPLLLFPNPAAEILHLQSNMLLHKVEVYDATGRRTLLSPEPAAYIRVDSLAPGVYFVKGYSHNRVVWGQFVKK